MNIETSPVDNIQVTEDVGFPSGSTVENLPATQKMWLSLLLLPRSVFDGRFDPATLDEEESRLLLAAMVNDYEQMRARESEKAQKTEGSR